MHSFRDLKGGRGVSPRFYLLVLSLVLIKIIKTQVESKILLCDPSVGKLLLRSSANCNNLLDRIAFRILPNIHDGAFLPK